MTEIRSEWVNTVLSDVVRCSPQRDVQLSILTRALVFAAKVNAVDKEIILDNVDKAYDEEVVTSTVLGGKQ